MNPQFKVDTGAQSNVSTIRLLCIIVPEKFDNEGNPKPKALEKNEAVVSAYGGSIIKQLGTINIPCRYKEKKINCIFYVADTSGPAILGLKACNALKLVSLYCTIRTNQLDRQADQSSSFKVGTCKESSNYIGSHVPLEERPSITSKQELMEMYPECFNGTVGSFGDYTYHITLDPEVSPVVHAPRKVPIELKDKLQAELQEMENQDIIAKVTQPTDWANSLVIREEENGRLRLCLDPKDLNKAIKREHHPMSTLEEITPRLAGAKLFSKLDGAIGIADDVTVHGKNDKQHDLYLHETMERTRKAGIKLNDDKCAIETKECNFAELMEMYPECFNGTVGSFGDYTYHITLDPEVSPVVHAPRKVPIELKDKLQAELQEMKNQDIIAKVTQPTDWANSLVIREEENGRLRLCLDPKDLNKAIKREHHTISTLEEITPKLAGAKLFSKLDVRNGYWNVKLD
ncbi:Uncharacterized protein K02A2.6 [Stylophora pistillata]|uniref:Uncharacterized protein K02A2.6 n=1 Tax=Stylophora pistillata TaxID=50429 RepID=A0A2B4SPQ5_STYPI|nr:Uncharacterized protein K02A2.6 [Stylophora pistillata]